MWSHRDAFVYTPPNPVDIQRLSRQLKCDAASRSDLKGIGCDRKSSRTAGVNDEGDRHHPTAGNGFYRHVFHCLQGDGDGAHATSQLAGDAMCQIAKG